MAYVMKVDGTQEKIKTPISMEAAHKACGTDMVEVIKLGAGWFMLCDEAAKMKGKPVNSSASLMLAGGVVAGDVIICINRKEAKGWAR